MVEKVAMVERFESRAHNLQSYSNFQKGDQEGNYPPTCSRCIFHFKKDLPRSHKKVFLFKNTTVILGWISLPKILIHYVATTTKGLKNTGEPISKLLAITTSNE
jgi:preprotein translocase subunit Sec63